MTKLPTDMPVKDVAVLDFDIDLPTGRSLVPKGFLWERRLVIWFLTFGLFPHTPAQ